MNRGMVQCGLQRDVAGTFIHPDCTRITSVAPIPDRTRRNAIASLRTLIGFTRIRTQAGLAHLCEYSRSLSVDTWADYGTDSPCRASSMLTPLVTRPWKIQQTQRTKRNLPPVQREKRDGRDDSKTPKILYSKKTRERGSKKTV